LIWLAAKSIEQCERCVTCRYNPDGNELGRFTPTLPQDPEGEVSKPIIVLRK